MKHTLILGTLAVVLALVGLGAWKYFTRPVVASGNSAKTPAPPAPHSAWQVSSTTNELTGVVTMLAVTEGSRRGTYGQPAVVVRQIGHKLECYVITGEFMASSGYGEYGFIDYKLDDGPIVKEQLMNLSQDHRALFFQKDVGGFIRSMAMAHKLTVEFKPYEKIPETATFDVASFPSDRFEIPPAAASDPYEIRPESDHPRPRIKQAAPRPRIKKAPKVFVPPTE
jgi:hypothetical protein